MTSLPARVLGAACCLMASGLFASAAAAEKAHDFTLRDLDNQVVTLSSYRGSVVLVDFWATWCGPCKDELPYLNKMYQELQDQGFVVLAISTDDARSASQVKPFVKRSGYTFPVPRDADSSVLVSYNPTKTLPYSVLVDRDGTVVARHAGYEPGDEKKLREKVLALLAVGAPEAAAPAPVQAPLPEAELSPAE